VNAQIYSTSGASAGTDLPSQSIPSKGIVPELIRSGKIITPGLGVELAEEQIAKKIGVSGVLIVDVARGGPAAKADSDRDGARARAVSFWAT
jgi:2-alkenal reductase